MRHHQTDEMDTKQGDGTPRFPRQPVQAACKALGCVFTQHAQFLKLLLGQKTLVKCYISIGLCWLCFEAAAASFAFLL